MSIARFAGNRIAAVSYTFDDGTLGHYRVAAPTLENYGFRGTFAIVPGNTADDPAAGEALAARATRDKDQVRRTSWQEWREIAARGHEIANHGLRHRGLPNLDPVELDREVNESARIIAAKLGLAPVSFIYPGNGRNPDVRAFVLKTHLATREREQRFGGPGFTVDRANAIVDSALKDRTALIIMIHAVAEEGYQPISAEDLDAHLRHVAGLRDQVWVATLGEAARYAREREATRLEITGQRPGEVAFRVPWTGDPLPAPVPLTSVIAGCPSGRTVTCRREGADLPVTRQGDDLLVDVLPGPGEVRVTWSPEP